MIEFYAKLGSRVFKIKNDFVFRYPAGEQDIKIRHKEWTGDQYCVIKGLVDPQNYLDLVMWSRVVKDQGGTPTAVIPYLPGGSGDKGVTQNSSIYASIINQAGCRVITFDAHSKKTLDMYNDIVNISSSIIADRFEYSYDGIIAPDDGAICRASDMAAMLDLPLFSAAKVRDFDSGKILSITLPELDTNIGSYLVVDDICDGGGTFTRRRSTGA